MNPFQLATTKRSKTVISQSKKEWDVNDDELVVSSNLALQFRSHTLYSGGLIKEKSFYHSSNFNDNYIKPFRFSNLNRPQTASYVKKAFSTLSPRRSLRSPTPSHIKETLLGKLPHRGRAFLTQEARSREVTCLSSSSPPGSRFDEDDEDDNVDLPKPSLEEIKKVLYKRECAKLRVTPVGKFLRTSPSTSLSIRYYSLGPEGAKALAVPLMLDATITTLDLEGNEIGPEGLASMAEMLDEHTTITTLNLRGNSLGSKGASIICKVLLNNRLLSSINLAANNFIDKDGLVFAHMLKENRHLKVLNLSDNSFGEQTGKVLGDALAQNEILEELDLQWNKFSGKGAAKLLQGIKENVVLKKLNLSFNSISRGTSKTLGNPLGDVLSGNSTLLHLDLSDCHLLDLDILGVAKGIKDNETLETLKIGHNLVLTQSVSVLVKAIALNDTSAITMLDLGDSVIEERALEDVEVLQSRNVQVIHGMVHQSETDFESKPRHDKNESNESNGSDESVNDEDDVDDVTLGSSEN